MKRTPFSVVVLAAFAMAACSVDARPESVRSAQGGTESGVLTADSAVSSWVQEGTITGAVLLVTRRGVVVGEQAYGFAQEFDYGAGQYPPAFNAEAPRTSLARLAEPVPMTALTVFDLASVTKVMATTMAMMVLVDRGQVDLAAAVSAYLPDFTGSGKDSVTVTHLLTHRSGLEQWKPIYYHATSPDQAYTYVRDLPLAWPVGEERHYSDLGFMLLGRIVERVSGMSLEAFVASEVYAPLGLAGTGFRPEFGPFAATSHGNPFERRMVYEPDFGYRIEGNPTTWDRWRRYTLLGEVNDGNAHHAFGGVAGHAGLFSTASDLTVLLQLLLNGGERDGRQLISAEVVQAFLTATRDDQALGWQSPAYAPPGSFAHTGFTGTFVLGVPSQALTIVLLTNRQNGGIGGTGSYPDLAPLQRVVVEAVTR